MAAPQETFSSRPKSQNEQKRMRKHGEKSKKAAKQMWEKTLLKRA